MEIVGIVFGVLGLLFAFERPRNIFLHLFGAKAQNQLPPPPPPAVPPALAKPAFSIKQCGFTGVFGENSKYSFLITNSGGDCFSLQVSIEHYETQSFPKVARGQSKKIEVSLPPGTESLAIVLSGLDANGNTQKKTLFGTRYKSGFEFS